MPPLASAGRSTKWTSHALVASIWTRCRGRAATRSNAQQRAATRSNAQQRAYFCVGRDADLVLTPPDWSERGAEHPRRARSQQQQQPNGTDLEVAEAARLCARRRRAVGGRRGRRHGDVARERRRRVEELGVPARVAPRVRARARDPQRRHRAVGRADVVGERRAVARRVGEGEQRLAARGLERRRRGRDELDDMMRMMMGMMDDDDGGVRKMSSSR